MKVYQLKVPVSLLVGIMQSFDFVIVGAGAAGCCLAAQLAKSPGQPQVLLLEAGGPNGDESHQSFGERFFTFKSAMNYNWGYKTVQQEELNGREIDQSRGKGLGGSTAINFCVFTRGSEVDYDRWAKIVDDSDWSWSRVRARFDKLEYIHPPPEAAQSFVALKSLGSDRPISISVPDIWEEDFGSWLQNVHKHWPRNLNHNSGDPLGVSVCQNAVKHGRRVTAASAFLESRPINLTVWTDHRVTKVIFEEKTAVGIMTEEKTIYGKEVILSAGAIDSPKILMLSGIGPAEDLKRCKIDTIQNLPGVGQNLLDRLFVEIVTQQPDHAFHRTSRMSFPEGLDAARRQWQDNRTGPLEAYFLPNMICYGRIESLLKSAAFDQLDSSDQIALQAPTKPHYEVIAGKPHLSSNSADKCLSFAVAVDNLGSTGSVRLSSGDPAQAPLIDPQYLVSPFQKLCASESLRMTLELLDNLTADGHVSLASGPKSRTSEDLLAYFREHATSMWHMCGTVRMGPAAQEKNCVDSNFAVHGVQNLRVVDASVIPFLLSAHPQAPTYLLADLAASKLIENRNKAHPISNTDK